MTSDLNRNPRTERLRARGERHLGEPGTRIAEVVLAVRCATPVEGESFGLLGEGAENLVASQALRAELAELLERNGWELARVPYEAELPQDAVGVALDKRLRTFG